MTLVSIIIPTYNHARFIAQAVRSALAQTHAALEVFVVDDGSTDDTQAVLAQFAGSITVVCQQNAGVCAARNNGLWHARGEYVLFLDSDDVLHPDAVAIKAALLDADPKAALAYSAWHYLDESGDRVLNEVHPKPAGDPLTHLLLRSLGFPPGNALLRRSMLKDAGGWDTSLSGAADTDLWIRLAYAGHAFAYSDEVLFGYRLVQNSMSRNYARQIGDEFKRLDKFFAQPGLPANVASLQRHARAIVHFEAAAKCYLIEDMAGGKMHMREGLALSPELGHDKGWLLNWLASFAQEPQVKEPEATLKRILDNLPEEAAHVRKLRRQVLGSYHIVAAYAAFNKRDYREVLRHVWPAAGMRPVILANRGFLLISLLSLLHLG
jgi:glycosyltransferase involved in cell wall biosynthesis